MASEQIMIEAITRAVAEATKKCSTNYGRGSGGENS